jgi:hypothetical protein
MKARMLAYGLSILVLGFGAWSGDAQEAEPGDQNAVEEEPAEDLLASGDVDVSRIDQILRGEQEVFEGQMFSYDPAGRRDPFRSLLEGFEDEEEGADRPRPPGLAGMLIEELTLEGIIQTSSGIMAFVQGRDNLSYIIRAGTKLYNGEVKEIQLKQVVFKRQVNDPKQLKPYEEVVQAISAD